MALGPTTGPDPLNESVLLPAFRVQAPGTALPPLTVSTSFRVGVEVAVTTIVMGPARALPTPRSASTVIEPTRGREIDRRGALWAPFETDNRRASHLPEHRVSHAMTE
jgi:hypothetical protein